MDFEVTIIGAGVIGLSIAKALSKKKNSSIWRCFFFLKDAFASLGPASVLTVHRSQGSTFGEVFISPDIFWPKDELLRKQLFYVAVSRAEKGAWIVGDKTNNLNKNIWLKSFGCN